MPVFVGGPVGCAAVLRASGAVLRGRSRLGAAGVRGEAAPGVRERVPRVGELRPVPREPFTRQSDSDENV